MGEREPATALRCVGLAISVVALVFVLAEVDRSLGELSEYFGSSRFLTAIAICAVAYGFVFQFVSIAWHRLLIAIDGPSLSIWRALAIVGRTQIYKYLPSNVLHMVGRFAIAREAGASHAALAFAQIGEVSIVILATVAVAALLAGSVLAAALARFGLTDPELVTTLIAAAFVIVTVGVVLLLHSRMRAIGYKALGASAEAFCLYVLFLVGNGMLIFVLSRSLSDGGGDTPANLIGIGATAWLMGFVVPGAPGGLGVREAVLVLGLSATGFPVAAATAVALGYRLVTIVGDGLIAVCELGIRRFRRRQR